MTQPSNGSAGLARRLALALVVCSALGSLGWLWWNCHRQPEIYFLPRMAPAEWIVYPSVPKNVVNARVELATRFQRSFTLERAPETAVLRVAGLRHCALLINGKPAGTAVRRGGDWKQPDEFEVAGYLRPGENDLTVTVSNSNGPPALWLSLEASGWRLNSDESWRASYGGASWRPARLASKPRTPIRGSPIFGGEEPWASLCSRWWLLLLFALASCGVYWLLGRAGSAPQSIDPRSRLAGLGNRERLLLLALAVLWVVLCANNLSVLPNLAGYDVNGHLAYVRYIQAHRSLPPANGGWEMFQPPLYYVLGAALLNALSLTATQDGGVMVLRLMGMAIGIAHLVLVWASLRLLFPGQASRIKWGLVLAAALPPVLYLSQYVSNEGLAATFVSAGVLLTLRMLKQEQLSWKGCAGLGLCLGAGLLTKSTALLALPAIFGALLWKSWLGPSAGAPGFGRRVPKLGLSLAICVAVCGWHYGRLWAQYGNPFIGVWDPRLGFSWWQDDGYRTGAFYFRFGAVLAHPWFGSFKSFADGIYSTLWGDGLFGGRADALARPPWNYDLMAVGYWLALVPTLAVLVGGLLAVVGFVRKPSAEWFLVLGLSFLAALAMVHLSLALPYACHVKAFYGLCALLPFCAFGAWGLDALGRWAGKAKPLVGVLAGVWAINSFASFWIAPSAAATVRADAQSLWNEKRPREAVELLAKLEREGNASAEAEACLAYLLMEGGNVPDATQLAQAAVQRDPAEPTGHLVLAALLARQHQIEEAIGHVRRALQSAPANESAYHQLSSLLLKEGRADEAVRVARDGLVVAPFNSDLRAGLGAALIAKGETAEGISQLQLACAIRPDEAGPRLLLGATLTSQGHPAEATVQLREVLRLEPANAEAHCQLADALTAQHQVGEAIHQYEEALRLEPDLVAGLNNLAWIRAANSHGEFRNGGEAVRLAERACQLTQFKEPLLVGTLAAAYAEAGRFDEAVATASKARDLALAAGQQDLADKNQKLAELFSARKPCRDKGDK